MPRFENASRGAVAQEVKDEAYAASVRAFQEESSGVVSMLVQRAADRAALRAAAYRSQSESRARKGVRRLCRWHDCRRLLTFTNGDRDGGWACRKAALDDVARFLRWHGALFFHRPMVLVAERGGIFHRWHVHAAMPSGGRLDYSRIIRAWSAYLERRGWRSSVVHADGWAVHRFHAGDEHGSHKSGFSSARVAARYLTKYLSKSFDEDAGFKGEHRYRAYCAASPPLSRYRSTQLKLLVRVLGLQSAEAYNIYVDGRFVAIGFDRWCAQAGPPVFVPDGAVVTDRP